jgi:hypothetical protein
MAASRVVYYDKDGNKKIFIGDPRKAPKTRGKPPVREGLSSAQAAATISKYSKGGYCRGAGAAIKGTKFEGVF